MPISHTPLLIALLAALPAYAHAHAHADEDDAVRRTTTLSAVEVKGETTATDASVNTWGQADAHDTPASITVIDRQQIERRHVRTLSELIRSDASLGDSYAPVGYYQNIASRGYALDLGTGYRSNGLTVVGEQIMPLEDKQQVEVLKGLAGLQAGIMEPGGLINYVSKRPEDVRNLTLGTDSHGSRYVAVDAGAWLTPNFGLRANLAWEDTHSYVQHADGRRNLYAIAADWMITPNASFALDTSYQTSAQPSVSGYQLLGGSVIPGNADPTRLLGHQPWQQPVAMRSSNTSLRFSYAFNDDWALRIAGGKSRSVIDDSVTFAYGCYYVAACASGVPGNAFGPNGEYDIYDYRNPDDTRITDQLRATLEGEFDTGNVGHSISIGGSTLHRSIDRHASVNAYVGSGNIADVEPPVFTPSPKQPGPKVRRLDSWQRSVFAIDRIAFNDAWQLVLGLQHARIDERAWNKRGVPERSTRLSKTLPQAALLWQPDDALTLYTSFSKGLSLGKEAPFWASNDGAMLGPRLSRQLELGAKYRLADTFDLTAALYRIHQPAQFAQPDASSAGFTFIELGEEVHTGVELGAHGRPIEHLQLDASLNVINARLQGTGVAALQGHQIVNVPRVRAAFSVDYSLPSAPALGLIGGWRYASSNTATSDGTVRVPAYSVFDAGLRYRSQWNQRTLVWQLSVDNVFNKFYWRDTGSVSGDSYLFPGAPRLARLSLTVGL